MCLTHAARLCPGAWRQSSGGRSSVGQLEALRLLSDCVVVECGKQHCRMGAHGDDYSDGDVDMPLFISLCVAVFVSLSRDYVYMSLAAQKITTNKHMNCDDVPYSTGADHGRSRGSHQYHLRSQEVPWIHAHNGFSTHTWLFFCSYRMMLT